MNREYYDKSIIYQQFPLDLQKAYELGKRLVGLAS